MIDIPDCPRCWVCDGLQLVDYGTDFLGRVWCIDCALVHDARRRRLPLGRAS